MGERMEPSMDLGGGGERLPYAKLDIWCGLWHNTLMQDNPVLCKLERIMHSTVDYTGKEDAHTKALKDCKTWLGTRQYNKVVSLLNADKGQSRKFNIILGLAMQGIQGYPANAMIIEHWSPQRELF
jgi:hypothetical protein